MSGEYKVPKEYAQKTRFVPSGLAREILLRMGVAPDDAKHGTGLRAHWDDNRTGGSIDLLALSIDGPYTLVKWPLTSSTRDRFMFNKKTDAFNVQLAPETDLIELDLTQLPLELEELLLQSQATSDSRERGSIRDIDDEMFEEMSAAITVQHVLDPRIYYPRHTKELVYEHVEDHSAGFYDDMVGGLIDQLRVTESFESFEIRKELFNISRQTEFRITDQAAFFKALTKALANEQLMQKVITEKPVESTD